MFRIDIKTQTRRGLFSAMLGYFNIAFDAILKFNEESGPHFALQTFDINSNKKLFYMFMQLDVALVPVWSIILSKREFLCFSQWVFEWLLVSK